MVLGSGSSCPQDFLFFAGLLWIMTGGGEACVDVAQVLSNAGDGDEPLWRSSILRYCGGEGCCSMRLSRWFMGEVKWVAVSMVACLQAGSSVNGWSLGWSVRKRMVKRERQQAALGVFVCGQLFTKGGPCVPQRA